MSSHIQQVLAASPFLGEGHRKVWARLRVQGIRTSKPRVPHGNLLAKGDYFARMFSFGTGSNCGELTIGTVLLTCEQHFRGVKGYTGIVQVLTTIETEQAEPKTAPTKKAA
ncbi:MAG: hypothetical protein KF693_11350 [Nitrospira sp.]|nr:hypothetical protein [Nitrospira sp.]